MMSFAIMLLVVLLAAVFVILPLSSSYLSAQQVAAQEPVQLELVATSDQGTFRIEILWTPNSIGQENTFDIHFIEPETGIEIEDVRYDISLLQEGGSLYGMQRLDQTATQQKFTFDDPGSYVIRIEDIEDLGEGAAIPIEVTPEFPLGLLMPLMAAMFGLIIIITRIIWIAARLSNGSKNLFT